jgi:hypothetical protein
MRQVSPTLLKHSAFRPFSTSQLSGVWLIANAAWRPMQILVRGGRTSELISLDRGQLSFSRSYLCKAWRWTSEKRVRTFLNRLKKSAMVGLQTGQLQTVITICNYAVFQNGDPTTEPANGPGVGRQRASKGPEEENIINITNNTPPLPNPIGLDEWYAVYPRKEAKQAAKRAFNAVLKSGLVALPVLIERTKAYAAAKNWPALSVQERKYIPLPATWLNAGRYDDELSESGSLTSPINPSSFSDEQWRNRLTRFRMTRRGSRSGGPSPASHAALCLRIYC